MTQIKTSEIRIAEEDIVSFVVIKKEDNDGSYYSVLHNIFKLNELKSTDLIISNEDEIKNNGIYSFSLLDVALFIQSIKNDISENQEYIIAKSIIPKGSVYVVRVDAVTFPKKIIPCYFSNKLIVQDIFIDDEKQKFVYDYRPFKTINEVITMAIKYNSLITDPRSETSRVYRILSFDKNSITIYKAEEHNFLELEFNELSEYKWYNTDIYCKFEKIKDFEKIIKI